MEGQGNGNQSHEQYYEYLRQRYQSYNAAYLAQQNPMNGMVPHSAAMATQAAAPMVEHQLRRQMMSIRRGNDTGVRYTNGNILDIPLDTLGTSYPYGMNPYMVGLGNQMSVQSQMPVTTDSTGLLQVQQGIGGGFNYVQPGPGCPTATVQSTRSFSQTDPQATSSPGNVNLAGYPPQQGYVPPEISSGSSANTSQNDDRVKRWYPKTPSAELDQISYDTSLAMSNSMQSNSTMPPNSYMLTSKRPSENSSLPVDNEVDPSRKRIRGASNDTNPV